MFTYYRYFDTVLKLFPIYIAYTFFTELLGYLIYTFDDFSFFDDKQYTWYNIIIFNIYALIVFVYFCWVYKSALRKPKHKKIIKIGAPSVLVAYALNLIFENPLYSGLYMADTIASLFYVWMALLYFSEGHWKTERHNLMFWVSLSLLLFHVIYPWLNLVGFLKPQIWIDYHFRTILKVLILVSYSMYLIGLLWCRRSAFR